MLAKIPEGLDEEARAIYEKIAKDLGLKIAKSKVIAPIPGIEKYIKLESKCSLCEFTTETYVKMLKYTDDTWRKDVVISKEEAEKLKQLGLHENNIETCDNCESFLMSKPKVDLVQMIITLWSSAASTTKLKKAIKELQKEKKK